MKLFKKITVSLLALSIVASTMLSPIQGKAAEISAANVTGYLDISEMDLSKTSDNITISEPLTYEQLADKLATDNNMSVEEAKKILGEPKTSIINSLNASPSSYAQYRTLSITVTVDSAYKVVISCYCETSETPQYMGIIKILYTTLMRSYNGISKQFSGNLYTNLEAAYRIYYSISGDFYNNGTTTFTGGVQIGLGEGSNISFSVSNSSNWYANISQYGTKTFP